MRDAPSAGQLEIQLGHLCNNRCVFCVSGQLTSRGEAPFLRLEDLRHALDRGWAAGHRRVTLLGGEPTIQPYFMDVVRHAVALGFRIVIFSNGSKPGRTDLVDEVAKTGADVEWRFSFQGATREAHERTTRRKGSFAQLLRSVDRARAHGHRVTVNMCVVTQNFESVDRFPELLGPRGVAQLHLDMVNPYDTGTATPAEITAMMPRYSDLAAPLARLIAAAPPGLDVNIGNLPHCVAPALAPFVHHGGERTWTITANDHGAAELGAGRRKYVLKQAFKTKPDSCRRCVYSDRCTGVFDAYAERFGTEELTPILPGDPSIGAIPVRPPAPDSMPPVEAGLPRSVAARLARLRARAPFGALVWTATDPIPGGVEITLVSPFGERVVAFCTETAEGPRAGYRIAGNTPPRAPKQAVSEGSKQAVSDPSKQAVSEALLDGVRRLLVAMGRLPEAAIARTGTGASSP